MERGHQKIPALNMSAAILAGGKGLRMGGTNKALLSLGEKNFLSHLLEVLEKKFQQIYISIKKGQKLPDLSYPLLEDKKEECGPMGGLESLLSQISTPSLFVVACDMPLLQESLVDFFCQEYEKEKYSALVPRDVEGHWIPTCGIYSKSILPVIQEQMEKKDFALHSLFSRISVQAIPPEIWKQADPKGLSFWNINTQQEYEMLKSYER